MTRPGVIEGPSAWRGCDLRAESDWVHTFDERDRFELAAVVEEVSRRGGALEDLDARSLRLPGLGPRLETRKQEILEGRGFVVFRGFPVDRFSRTEQAIAYWVLGTRLGKAVSQNAQGHLLGHVRDAGLDPDNPEHRVYATNHRHRFHTDSCDVVGLLCLQPAKRGGLSSVVSSVSIHNAMLVSGPISLRYCLLRFRWTGRAKYLGGRNPSTKCRSFIGMTGRYP